MPLPAETSSKRQERTAEHVGFDVHHDEVLAVVDGSERVPDAGNRAARRLDDAFDLAAPGERAHVVQDAGLPGPDGVAEAGGAEAFGGPANAGERPARLADVEIGDPYDVEPRDALGLRQHHGTELAGADQPDPDRAAARRPLLEHGRKVHAVLPCRCDLRAGDAAALRA